MCEGYEICSQGDSDLQEVKPIYEGYDLTLDDDRNGYLNAGFIEDEDETTVEIGLDSGADVSVMPFSWEIYGSDSWNSAVVRLRDAQGNIMPHGPTKKVTLEFDEVSLVENFTPCSVSAPLLALGKLIRKGWSFQHDNGALYLVNDGVSIPVKVRGNALSISARVRSVKQDFWSLECGVLKRIHNVKRYSRFTPEDPGCPFPIEYLGSRRTTVRADGAMEEDDWRNSGELREAEGWTGCTIFHVQSDALIRSIIVNMNAFCYEDMVSGWNLLDIGVPAHKGVGDKYLDTRDTFPMADWPYRSTFVKVEDKWILTEWCERLSAMQSLTAVIPEARMGPSTKRLTLLHVDFDAPESLQIELVDDFLEAVHVPKPDEEDQVPGDPFVDEPQEAPALPEQDAADRPRLELHEVGQQTVLVEGVALSVESGSAALREACRSLGLGTSGSKKILFKRLQTACAKKEIMEGAATVDAAQPQNRQPDQVQPVPEPNLHDRTLHELTHTPYQKWCEICVAVKGRRDRHGAQAKDARKEAEICMDLCYTGYSADSFYFMKKEPVQPDGVAEIPGAREAKQTVLVLLDRLTGMTRAIPLPSKESTSYAAREACAFIAYLGHSTVHLKSDNEPAMLNLQQRIANARAKHDMRTLITNSQLYEHETNGAVEQAIQALRNSSMVLLEQIRAKTGNAIGVTHPLFAWSFVHGSFIQNHFAVQGGTTAYERCFGVAYSGKLCNFGEAVLTAISPGHRRKGNVKFVKMIWVGKTLNNNMNICLGPHGAYLSRSIRRLVLPACWDGQMLKEVAGYPWSYGLGQIGTKLVPGLKSREPARESVFMGVLPPMESASGLRSQMQPNEEAASDPESEQPQDPVEAGRDEKSQNPAQAGKTEQELEQEHQRGSEKMEQSSASGSNPGMMPPPPSAAVSKRATAEEIAGGEFGPPMPKMQRGGIPDYERDNSDDGSPSKKAKVNVVTVDGEEYADGDETCLYDAEIDEDIWSWMWEEDNAENDEDQGPPDVDSEQLHELDAEAEQRELDRLIEMSVLRKLDTIPEDGAMLNAKMVLDWRFRQNKWIRRARLVGKELKIWSPWRQDVFSPATNPAVVKVVPHLYSTHAKEWVMCSLDIKDAFLTVRQREKKYIRFNGEVYELLMCLPGQRQAGQWWGDQIREDLLQFGLNASKACPVLFGNGELVLVIHVDDVIVAGKRESVEGLIAMLKKKYEISLSGPISLGGESVRFLKKKLTITDAGIKVELNQKYYTQLEKILGGSVRSKKVPCHAQFGKLLDGEPLGLVEAQRCFCTWRQTGLIANLQFQVWQVR